MSDAVQLVLSAVVGGLAGTFATAYKSRKELESLYDIELRRKRMDAYGELWKLLEPLAYWAPPNPLTYKTLASVSRALRSWYFVSGGLVLSKQTRGPYFNLQQALTELSAGDRGTSEEALKEDTREIVKALASRLRTASTNDVATRVVPALGQRVGARLRAVRRRPPPVRVEIDRRWDFKKSPPAPAFLRDRRQRLRPRGRGRGHRGRRGPPGDRGRGGRGGRAQLPPPGRREPRAPRARRGQQRAARSHAARDGEAARPRERELHRHARRAASDPRAGAAEAQAQAVTAPARRCY